MRAAPYGNLFGLAPGGVYRATNCCQPRGVLLPHPFTLTCSSEDAIGGLLSAALVVGLRRPGVTWHPALWSPDFPPPYLHKAAVAWLTPAASVMQTETESYALTATQNKS